MKTARRFSSIFLPAIFLLSMGCLAGKPGFENVP
jgi:hypothetical protein